MKRAIVADGAKLHIWRLVVAFIAAPLASILAYVVWSEIEGLSDLFILGFLSVPMAVYVTEVLLALLFFFVPRRVLPIRWYTIALLAGGVPTVLIAIEQAIEGQYNWDDPGSAAYRLFVFAPAGAYFWLLAFSSFNARQRAAA